VTSIKKLKNTLAEIENAPISAGCEELWQIMRKADVPMPVAGMDSIKDKCIKSLHTSIQTEMMIKSCNFAKWSCFWAFVAATVALVGTILTLFVALNK
jgi:hypothetical protein